MKQSWVWGHRGFSLGRSPTVTIPVWRCCPTSTPTQTHSVIMSKLFQQITRWWVFVWETQVRREKEKETVHLLTTFLGTPVQRIIYAIHVGLVNFLRLYFCMKFRRLDISKILKPAHWHQSNRVTQSGQWVYLSVSLSVSLNILNIIAVSCN